MHIYLCVCVQARKTFRCQTPCWSNMLLSTIVFMLIFAHCFVLQSFSSRLIPRRGAPRLIKKAPPDQGRFNWPWYVSFSASLMKLSIQSTDRKMLWSFCVFNGKMKLVEKGNYHRSTAGNKVDFKNASLFFTTHSILRCTFIVNFLLLLHLVLS